MGIKREETTVVKEYFVTSTGEKFENKIDALRVEADFLSKEGRLKTFSAWNYPETISDCEIVYVADEEAREVFEEFSDVLGLDRELCEEGFGWFFYYKGAWHSHAEILKMIAEGYRHTIVDCERKWRERKEVM